MVRRNLDPEPCGPARADAVKERVARLRIEALRYLSRDTARVELWDCPLAQALLVVLLRVQGRAKALGAGKG